jgi:hypothetical protein
MKNLFNDRLSVCGGYGVDNQPPQHQPGIINQLPGAGHGFGVICGSSLSRDSGILP